MLATIARHRPSATWPGGRLAAPRKGAVLCLATHTESAEWLVVYRDAQGRVWARPERRLCAPVDLALRVAPLAD